MTSSSMQLSPTSVRVTHAPGGNSSFSLAWQSSVPPPQIAKQSSPRSPKENNNFDVFSPPKGPFQSYSPSLLSLTESNRLLEEELRYYQQKNKMLRENIFGGVDNSSRLQQHSNRAHSLSPYHGTHDPYHYGQTEDRFGAEELELALQDRERKRNQERQPRAQYFAQEVGQLERSSVRVSLPPGGRSSIVFG